MRYLSLLLLASLACGHPAVETPIPDSGRPPAIACSAALPPNPSWRFVALPADLPDEHEVSLNGPIVRGEALVESHLTYALGGDYPASLRVHVSPASYFYGCEANRTSPAAVPRWTSVVEDQADGVAHLQVSWDGQLLIGLLGAGTAHYTLTGELVAPDGGAVCDLGGAAVGRVPFLDSLTIDVRAVSGFDVVSPWPGCDPRLAQELPAAAWVDALPSFVPVDADGGRFSPLNGPQLGVYVTSTGGIEAAPFGGGYRFSSGTVTLQPDTTLPVHGSTTLTVVDPSQVSQIDVGYLLETGPTKVPEEHALDGGAIVFRPEERPRLKRYADASLRSDRLCVAPPPEWFCVRSSTPEVCDGADDFFGYAVRGPGVCRLETTLTGTSRSWSFEATFVDAGSP